MVGSNLCQRLKGLRTNLLSTYFSKEPSFLEEYYKRFDFTQFEDCIKATKDMDYVFVCAAQTSGAKMMKEDPAAQILPNLKINAGLLEACRRNCVKKVMLISSSTVYQEADYPISEDQLDLNKSPYELYFGVGWMNRYIEQLAKFYKKAYGIEIGIVRPTNIYGPYDNFDETKSNVLPALIRRALKKEDPYIVWGSPDTVRDFIYVDDFIDDFLDVFSKRNIYESLNIASGEGTKIKDAVRIILDACNHNARFEFDQSKPTSISYRMLSTSKFESIFGKKKRTSLRRGIEKTIDWYKSTSEFQDFEKVKV